MDLVDPSERRLFFAALIVSAVAWGALAYVSPGGALAVIAALYAIQFMIGSAFAGRLRGTGAQVSHRQFAGIDRQVKACAEKLGLKRSPEAFVVRVGGTFGAMTARVLRRDYVALLSDMVEAFDGAPEPLGFFIGHEIGHIKRRHDVWEPVLAPALLLPLLGPAYARSREYTCDRHGRACCTGPQAPQRALLALAVGGRNESIVYVPEYLRQLEDLRGFWPSFFELTGSYPPVIKRLARLFEGAPPVKVPPPNPAALLAAAVVPRLTPLTVMTLVGGGLALILSSGG